MNIKFFLKLRLNETLNNDISYYTTSRIMTINDFIEIEVEERDNYDIDDVNEWVKKYNITNKDDLIWVSTEPYIAARYQMNAEDWDNAEEIYYNNPDEFDVEKINSNDGFIIPETDDGDNGFIFIFRKKQ